MKEFSYIIAKVWNPVKPATPPNLGVYMYFQELQYGTLQEAKTLLEEIQRRNPENKYKIYPVTVGEPIE